MDRITYDVMEAERLGYGVHYGHYKADHPCSEWDEEKRIVPESIPPRKCRECEREFVPDRPNMYYCSDDCRSRRNSRLGYHKRQEREKLPIGPAVCPICGSDFYRKYSHTKTCGRSCAAYIREHEKKRVKRETSSDG